MSTVTQIIWKKCNLKQINYFYFRFQNFFFNFSPVFEINMSWKRTCIRTNDTLQTSAIIQPNLSNLEKKTIRMKTWLKWSSILVLKWPAILVLILKTHFSAKTSVSIHRLPCTNPFLQNVYHHFTKITKITEITEITVITRITCITEITCPSNRISQNNMAEHACDKLLCTFIFIVFRLNMYLNISNISNTYLCYCK